MDIKTALKITNPNLTRFMKLKLMMHELEQAALKYGFDLEFGELEYNEENVAVEYTLIQSGLNEDAYEDGIQRIKGALIAWIYGSCEIDEVGKKSAVIDSEGVIDAWIYSLDARDVEPEYRPKRWENA